MTDQEITGWIREHVGNFLSGSEIQLKKEPGDEVAGVHIQVFQDMNNQLGENFILQDFIRFLQMKTAEFRGLAEAAKEAAIQSGQYEIFMGERLVHTPEYVSARLARETYRDILCWCYNKLGTMRPEILKIGS